METTPTNRERREHDTDSEHNKSQMSLYQNQPINLDRPAIRLLKLIRGFWSDEIQCNIFSGWFDESETIIPYAALSYTWGSTSKVANITVDNTTVKVTSNLHMALQHLRFEKEDRILWIDAICINQDNSHEKIHQIRQMGDIYKKAEEVIVWLGDGNENTDFTMDAMMRLQEYRLQYGGDWRGLAEHWMQYQQLLIEQFGTRVRTGMNVLLSRSWFRRIWILQEIANARIATVHCGNFSVSARIFAQFPVLVCKVTSPPFSFDIPFHCQSVLDIMPGLSRKESWWERDRRLHTLLVKFRDSQATDSRDMIYALLGISSDVNDRDTLYLRYDKPLRQVFQDTISFIIHKKYSHTSDTKYDALSYDFLDWTLPQFLANIEKLNSVILGDASELGKKRVVKFLLTTDGIEIDLKDNLGRTPLERASQKGRKAVVKLLLERSALSASGDSEYSRKLLAWAIDSGDEDAVKHLLEGGSDPEAKDKNNRTALSLAARNGKIAIVKLLLEKGGNYETQDINGQTPLTIASGSGEKEIVKLLLNHGAKYPVEAKNVGFFDMVRFLIQSMVSIINFLFWIFHKFHRLVAVRFDSSLGMFRPFRIYRVFGIWGLFQIFLPFVVFRLRQSLGGRKLRSRHRNG